MNKRIFINKRIFFMFALMLVLLPICLFAGCAGDQSGDLPKVAVQLQLKNTPDTRYFDVLSDPSGQVAQDASATFKIKFKNGYRPDNLSVQQNGQPVTTSQLRDVTTSETYTAATPLSHEIEWSYTISKVTEATVLTVDFAECVVGEVRLELNANLQDGKLKYVVFDEEPVDAVVSNSADLTSLIGTKSIQTANGTAISLPFGSYAIFFVPTNTTMLFFQDKNATTTDPSAKAVAASLDKLNLNFYQYKVGVTDCRIMSVNIDRDEWNYMSAITSSTPNSPNKFAGTFAISTLLDGSTVTGLATQSDLAQNSGLMSPAEAGSDELQVVSYQDADGATHSFYALSYTGLIFCNITDSNITEKRQQDLAERNRLWVEDDIIMSIAGIGHFNRDEGQSAESWDHLYLSTSANISEDDVTTVDISEYVIKSGATFFVHIPRADILEILEANPAFIENFNNAQYGFAYLVYDKNETINNALKLTLEGVDHLTADLNPYLCGFEVDANDRPVNEHFGGIIYVDYTHTDSEGNIAPVYYLNTAEVKNNAYVLLCFQIDVETTEGVYYLAYESFTYQIKASNQEDFTTETVNFTEEDYQSESGKVLKFIRVDTSLNYTLRLTCNTRAYDNTSHQIINTSGQDIYYYVADLGETIDFPTAATGWQSLSATPINTVFNQMKVLYFLTELTTTDTTTEKLSLKYISAPATDTTDAEYDELFSSQLYQDMLGHPAAVMIGDKTYQVNYILVPPSYYSANMQFFAEITTSTTAA